MSKAIKKKMREIEEEKIQKQLLESNDKVNFISQNKKKNLFAGFGADSSSEEEQIQEIQKQEQIEEQQLPIQQEQTQEKKKKKRKKKKKKNKAQKQEEEIEKEEDQIEENIEIEEEEEIQQRFLLSVSKKEFNYNKELNQVFQVKKLVETNDYHGMNKKQQRIYKHQLKANKPKKKYYLVHNDDVIQKINYKLEMEKIRENDKFLIFTFQPPKKIKDIEDTFQDVRNTGDPNMLQEFLMNNPYHPEALYSLGEYFRLQGNYKEANLLMEKLLFFYEESLTYEFKVFMEEENQDDKICILDSKGEYNILFFKAILKFIVILLKKSLFKTSFNFTKFLLKLNPFDDPYGALILIDHVAILGKKFQWLLDFSNTFGEDYITKGTTLILYPNFLYSRALCMFELQYGNKDISEIQKSVSEIDTSIFDRIFNFDWNCQNNDPIFYLTLAIVLFPNLLIEIQNKTEQFKHNYSCSYFKGSQKKNWNELFEQNLFKKPQKQYVYPFLNIIGEQGLNGIEKVIEIYSTRNTFWKKKKYQQWIRSVLGALIDYLEGKDEFLEEFNEKLIIPDDQTKEKLKQFILPFEPTKHIKLLAKNFEDENEQFDIHQIPDNIPQQQNLMEGLNELNPDQNWLQLLINSFVPWNIAPQNPPPNQDQLIRQKYYILYMNKFFYNEQKIFLNFITSKIEGSLKNIKIMLNSSIISSFSK